MRNLRDDALMLAGLGWPVFPLHSPDGDRCDCRREACSSPAKHPRTLHGLKDATTNLDTILHWWEMWPGANIGVPTGPVSGLVALDVDARHGGLESVNALIDEHGQFPFLPFSRTGSGGNHYLFAYPDVRVPNSANLVAQGIDVRGDGGYIVAPPSAHITGAMYEWVTEDGVSYAPSSRCLPAAIPQWLLDLMIRPGGTDKFAREDPEDVPQGQRHQLLTSIAGSLRYYGRSESQIMAALMAINAEWSNPQDAIDIARIAHDYAQKEAGVRVQIVNDLAEEKQRQQLAGLPEPYEAPDLETMEFPPVKWAVPEMLPEGLALLAGASKLGKSWMALGLAIAIALGGIALEQIPCEDGDALYVALEDPRRRMKSRLRDLMGEEPFPRRLSIIDMSSRMPQMDQGGMQVLDLWLGRHPEARLVVIDTWQRFRGRIAGRRNGNAYEEDVAAAAPLQELAGKHCVCILLIHHVRKAFQPGDDWMDRISGSAGLGATADTSLGLFRSRGIEGQKDALLRRTGREVIEGDLRAEFDGLRWRITGTADEPDLSPTAPRFQRLLEHMEKRPWEKYGVKEVQFSLGIATYDGARMLLNEAKDAGLILKVGRGEYRLPDAKTILKVGHNEDAPENPSIETVLRFASVVSETEGEPPNRSETKPIEAQKETEGTSRRNWPELPPKMVGRACSTCRAAEPWVWTGHSWMCGVCRPHLRVVEG